MSSPSSPELKPRLVQKRSGRLTLLPPIAEDVKFPRTPVQARFPSSALNFRDNKKVRYGMEPELDLPSFGFAATHVCKVDVSDQFLHSPGGSAKTRLKWILDMDRKDRMYREEAIMAALWSYPGAWPGRF